MRPEHIIQFTTTVRCPPDPGPGGEAGGGMPIFNGMSMQTPHAAPHSAPARIPMRLNRIHCAEQPALASHASRAWPPSGCVVVVCALGALGAGGGGRPGQTRGGSARRTLPKRRPTTSGFAVSVVNNCGRCSSCSRLLGLEPSPRPGNARTLSGRCGIRAVHGLVLPRKSHVHLIRTADICRK